MSSESSPNRSSSRGYRLRRVLSAPLGVGDVLVLNVGGGYINVYMDSKFHPVHEGFVRFPVCGFYLNLKINNFQSSGETGFPGASPQVLHGSLGPGPAPLSLLTPPLLHPSGVHSSGLSGNSQQARLPLWARQEMFWIPPCVTKWNRDLAVTDSCPDSRDHQSHILKKSSL